MSRRNMCNISGKNDVGGSCNRETWQDIAHENSTGSEDTVLRMPHTVLMEQRSWPLISDWWKSESLKVLQVYLAENSHTIHHWRHFGENWGPSHPLQIVFDNKLLIAKSSITDKVWPWLSTASRKLGYKNTTHSKYFTVLTMSFSCYFLV